MIAVDPRSQGESDTPNYGHLPGQRQLDLSAAVLDLLALERHVFGDEPGGFHFTSLLLHWTDGVLLFVLLRRLRMRPPIAALATLIWLGMPVNSEAVAWISGQLYPLSTAFLVLALLLALV